MTYLDEIHDERDAFSEENAALRAEVERLRAALADETKRADDNYATYQRVVEKNSANALRVQALEAALKPFAALAQHYARKYGNRPNADNDPIFGTSSGNLPDSVITVGDLRKAAALLTPPDTQRTLPPTPELSEYAQDIIALANGNITEAQFCERQGRKPL